VIIADSLLKVIEVLTESDKSWEDAAQSAVSTAAESIHGIKPIYIKNLEAKVEDKKFVKYRNNASITFLLN